MRYLLAVLFLMSVGCSSKIMMNEKPFYNEANGASATLVWIKNKGDSLDFLVDFENKYPYPILIQEKSMSASYMGQKNYRAHRSNERMVLRPGDRLDQLAVLGFRPEINKGGSGKLKIVGLYEYKNDEKGKALPPIVVPYTLKMN